MSRLAHPEGLHLLCVPGGRPLAIGNPASVDRVIRSTGLKFAIMKTYRNKSLTCDYAEPPIGIEPITYALRGTRAVATHALAAPIARVTALTALTTLGLCRDPFHEPFHAPRPHVLSFCP